MKVMTMRAIRVTFCVAFIAVFATGSSDNSLTNGNSLPYNCSQQELFLNISKSIIKAIGDNFINSPLITCLSLQENQIESITKGAFDSVPALEYLNIAGNMISDVMSFGSHDNLRTLILANQSVNYYNKQLQIQGIYPQLRYLDLSGNKLHSLNWRHEKNDGGDYYWDGPEQAYYDTFPALEYLDMSHNAFERLFHTEYPLSPNLTYLLLHDNNLRDLSLQYFTNLLVLTVDANNIRSASTINCYDSICVSKMPKLKYLSISNNQLRSIYRDFFKSMHELAILNLSGNELDNDYIDGLQYLISLKDLNLDKNFISNISLLNGPPQLFSLSLNLNKIKYIHSEDLMNTPNLRKLYLNGNKIQYIDENAFRSLESLEELDLANNVLNQLPAEWSNNLRSLRYLNLTNNQFMHLESLSLNNASPLIHINLIDNQIISLTPEVFRDLPENVTIYLSRDQRKIALDSM